MNYPDPGNNFLDQHVAMLLDSYRHWLGKPLLEQDSGPYDLAREVFYAPFAVISHNTEADPVFNYANKKALALFECAWDEMTQMSSRLSAEPVQQAERAKLLAEVTQNGYIEHYQGVRIAKSGNRFIIKNATVWNLIDQEGRYSGQAAFFKDWQYL